MGKLKLQSDAWIYYSLVWIVLLSLFPLGVSELRAEYEIQVVNTSERNVTNHQVVIPLEKLPPSLRKAGLNVRGRARVPCQVEQSGKNGRLVFLADFDPGERRKFTIENGTSSPPTEKLKVEKQNNSFIMQNEHLRWVLPRGKVLHRGGGEWRAIENPLLIHYNQKWDGKSKQNIVSRGPSRLVVESHAKSGSMSMTKRYFMYPGRKEVTVQLIYRNHGDRPVTIPNDRGTYRSKLGLPKRPEHGVWGPALRPEGAQKFIQPDGTNFHSYLRTDRKHELVIDPGTGVAMGRILHTVDGWRRLEHQPKTGQDYWHFGLDHFRHLEEYETFKRALKYKKTPYVVPANSSRSTGVTLTFYKRPEEETVELYREDVMRSAGVVNVYGEDGSVLNVAGAPEYLVSGPEDVNVWTPTGGAKIRPAADHIKLTARPDQGGMQTVLTRDFRHATELRAQFDPAREDTALKFILRDLDSGETHDLGTFSKKVQLSLSEKLDWKETHRCLLKVLPVTGSGPGGSNVSPRTVNISRISLEWPLPAPPEQRFPYEDSELSSNAVSFGVVTSMDKGWEYAFDVMVSGDKTFDRIEQTHRKKIKVDVAERRNREDILSGEDYPVGTYHWRARSVSVGGVPGEWGSTKRFAITDANPDPEPAPFERPVTPEHPAFVSGVGHGLHHQKRFGRLLDGLTEDIRQHYVGEKREKGWTRGQLHRFAGEDPRFNVIMRYQHSGASLSQLEYMFKKYPNVMGFYFGEKGFENRAYLDRALKLSARHGRYAGTLTGWHHMRAGDILSEYRPEYRKHYLPVVKSNNVGEPYARYLSAAGLYLCGRTSAWGAETEWGAGNKGWPRQERTVVTRPLDWMHPLVVGLSMGATIYRIEGFTNAHANYGYGIGPNPNELGPLYHRAVKPFYEDILKHDLIPTRKEILNNVKIAFRGKSDYGMVPPSSKRSVFPSNIIGAVHGFPADGPRRKVFRHQWINNESRYIYAPILPPNLDPHEEAAFEEVVSAEDFDGPAEVRSYFNQVYDPVDSEAYAVLLGDTGVVINSIDLRYEAEPQTYKLTFPRGPVRELRGEVTYREYLITKTKADSLFIHTNDYQPKFTEFTLRSRNGKRPQLDVQPSNALVETSWNGQKGRLYVRLNHYEGASRVTVRPGN